MPFEITSETLQKIFPLILRWWEKDLEQKELRLKPIDQINEGLVHLTSSDFPFAIDDDKTMDYQQLLSEVLNQAVPLSLDTTSGGYMAYIPGGGLASSAIADLIALIGNRYVGIASTAPVLLKMEIEVIKWLLKLFNFPEDEAKGILTSGGSTSNMLATICARHHLLGTELAKGVIYISEHAHHSIEKSAYCAGIMPHQIRKIAVTGTHQKMDLIHLQRLIAEDKSQNCQPFLIVGSAGTTNCGACDPLEELAAIAKEHQCWFHIDAAYGGFFQLTNRGQKILKGIELADSIALDPHKGLFLPYGTGALIIRDGKKQRAAFTYQSSYIAKDSKWDELDLWDFSELGHELSREARGLRAYFPLKLHGPSLFRQELDLKLDLTQYLYQKLLQIPSIKVLLLPDLSLINFCLVGDRSDSMAELVLNQKTQNLMMTINEKNRVYLSGTTLQNIYCIRVCILSVRTKRENIDELLTDLQSSLLEMGFI